MKRKRCNDMVPALHGWVVVSDEEAVGKQAAH
jgi:hypothetical protein